MELDRRRKWNWKAKVEEEEFFYDTPSRLSINLLPPKKKAHDSTLVCEV